MSCTYCNPVLPIPFKPVSDCSCSCLKKENTCKCGDNILTECGDNILTECGE